MIDSGFSHSTVTPLYKGRPVQQAIRRLDVGGKLLTNFLKELLSIRHYNLMNEEHLVNEAKEKICFVSNAFNQDLEQTWKGTLKKAEINSRKIQTSLSIMCFQIITRVFRVMYDLMTHPWLPG